MKVSGFWLIVVAVLAAVLGALFVKQCASPKCPPIPEINLDSLKATLEKPPVILPGEKEQVIRWLPKVIDLTDTAAVDSLLRVLEEQEAYFAGLRDQLEDGIRKKEEQLADAEDEIKRLELLIKVNEYQDSVRTDSYFHKWAITAEGPIRSYSYSIIPFCPQPLAVKTPAAHRIGLGAGGQAEAGAIRPLYAFKYQYKWLWASTGYLPGSDKLQTKDAVQIVGGFTIGIK